MEGENERKRDRKGLGRGLGALLVTPEPESPFSSTAEGSAREAENRLNPAQIEPNPFQPRLVFDPVKLAELADSIRTHGVLQPLIVRKIEGRYQLVSGERRWRASQQAGLAEVPVIVRALTDREMLEVALVENVQREDIGPMEAATAYKRLAEEFHLTQEEIAQRVGKSRSAVTNTIRLLNLSPEIQGSLSEGRITEGHARALLSIKDDTARERTWRALLETGGSVREAEEEARQNRAPSAKPAPLKKDPHLQAVEERMRRVLGTKVEIVPGRGERGIVSIEYYSDDDLNRILESFRE